MTAPPFALTPCDGEPIDLWLSAYAVRLGVSAAEMAESLGLPGADCPGASSETAGTALPHHVINALSFAPEHRTDPGILRAWRPGATTRFCPDCLTGGTGLKPDWSTPLTFFCLGHDRLLASHCPSCGNPVPNPDPRFAASRPSGCGHDLSAAPNPAGDPTTARLAQHRINTLTTQLRDPALAPAARRRAAEDLVDLTVIAFHLAIPAGLPKAWNRQIDAAMLDAATLTEAVTLFTAEPSPGGEEPIKTLLARHQRRKLSVVPMSWRKASPRLRHRIAVANDAIAVPAERLRWASTLHAPFIHTGSADPAPGRVSRLPDQLWPAWAIRLTNDDAIDGHSFRTAVIAALALPGSRMLMRDIAALRPDLPRVVQTTHQLRRLAGTPNGTTALAVLTQLATGIDNHGIPIDYPRRKALTADTELIDDTGWRDICAGVFDPGGAKRLAMARCYLYEILTGGSIAIAQAPYQIPPRLRADWTEFCVTLPATVARRLHQHAEQVLAAAGITDEPPTWSPPTDWVTVTDWPGADPDRTDPAVVHAAVAARWAATTEHWTPTAQAAAALGISGNHLRHVLRLHPIADPPYTLRRPRGVYAMTTAADQPGHRIEPHPDDPRHVFLIDITWFNQQYHTYRRTISDIATEIGCKQPTLRHFAAEHPDIQLRPRSGGGTFITAGTIPRPETLPDLLRKALSGQHARLRIKRFLAILEHPSLGQAAKTFGITQGALTTQLKTLERNCGGQLLHHNPCPRPIGPLTPLGAELCRQIEAHLGPDLMTEA